MHKISILLSGYWDLGPIGRHGLSFLSTLILDDRFSIYIDSSYINSKSISIIKEFSGKNYEKIQFSEDKDENFTYDFSLYFHVLGITPSDDWFHKAHLKKSIIKICYPVFDGTVPPLEWIEKINKNFDICLTPSKYVAHNLCRHGVTIDCLNLECVVFINEFINFPIKKQKTKFRFGLVSGLEARKNIEFIVRSFSKAFSKADDVELFIHSVDRKDLLADYGELKKIVSELQNQCNVILHEDFVSHVEMQKIYQSFDAYVIPQRNTGYFTTPIEALACGIPVILSDIPVHRELEEYFENNNSLFFVPHKKLVPEYHFVFDYRNLGVSFDANEKDYVDIFKLIYEQRNSLCSEELAIKRKKYASNFTEKALTKAHSYVFKPNVIAENDKSYISNDGIFSMSKSLMKKYRLIYSDIKSINFNYKHIKRKFYIEEKDPVFQAIEYCALKSQNIYLINTTLTINNTLTFKTSINEQRMLRYLENNKISKKIIDFFILNKKIKSIKNQDEKYVIFFRRHSLIRNLYHQLSKGY